jgi:hypothetical protein
MHNNNNNNNSFVYLRAEPTSQWPIPELAWIQTPTAVRQNRTNQTKNECKTVSEGRRI